MAKQFRWSVSRILKYLSCPYAYFLQYKQKITAPKPYYLVFGGAVHKAIEICHRGNPRQRFQPTTQRPLFFQDAKAFGGFWIGHWQREVAKAEKETGIEWHSEKETRMKELTGLGYAMLAGTQAGSYQGYYQCILKPPFPVEILEVEWKIPKEVKLWGYSFTGFIDQIWRTPEGTALVDITTSQAEEVKFFQITIYDLCLQEACRLNLKLQERFGGGAQAHYVWALRQEKLVRIQPDPEASRETFAAAVAGIEAGDFHESPQDQKCRFCEFREICGKTGQEFINLPLSEQKLQLALPELPPKPKYHQPPFPSNKGVKGGWIRGQQVKEGKPTGLG